MWQSYLNGMLVAFGLIMAIGAQNAFVLAQSLRREHHLPVAVLCIVCDAILVAAGVFGLATVLAHNPTCWRSPAGAVRCSSSGTGPRLCAVPVRNRACSTSRARAHVHAVRYCSVPWR